MHPLLPCPAVCTPLPCGNTALPGTVAHALTGGPANKSGGDQSWGYTADLSRSTSSKFANINSSVPHDAPQRDYHAAENRLASVTLRLHRACALMPATFLTIAGQSAIPVIPSTSRGRYKQGNELTGHQPKVSSQVTLDISFVELAQFWNSCSLQSLARNVHQNTAVTSC